MRRSTSSDHVWDADIRAFCAVALFANSHPRTVLMLIVALAVGIVGLAVLPASLFFHPRGLCERGVTASMPDSLTVKQASSGLIGKSGFGATHAPLIG
jgi:hypothetical protein